jgi:hypothetical protein
MPQIASTPLLSLTFTAKPLVVAQEAGVVAQMVLAAGDPLWENTTSSPAISTPMQWRLCSLRTSLKILTSLSS